MTAFPDPETRKLKIKAFGNAYQKLEETVNSVPEDALFYRSRRDVWNINEMIIHLADLEAAAYVNFRRAIAEPTEVIMAFDKDLWAESLGYYNQPYQASMKLLRLLRTSNYLLLKNLSQDVWLHTVNYPEHGQISLEDLLDLYVQHHEKVISEIYHNVDTWKKKSEVGQ